jgi:mRNA interferase RelE/StbE
LNCYKIKFLKEAELELKKMDKNLFIKVSKALVKVAADPLAYSEPLGQKMNMNLTGLRKVYVDDKRIRIVFLVVEERLFVLVVSLNRRDKGKVYQITKERIDKYNSLLQKLRDTEIDINDIFNT